MAGLRGTLVRGSHPDRGNPPATGETGGHRNRCLVLIQHGCTDIKVVRREFATATIAGSLTGSVPEEGPNLAKPSPTRRELDTMETIGPFADQGRGMTGHLPQDARVLLGNGVVFDPNQEQRQE